MPVSKIAAGVGSVFIIALWLTAAIFAAEFLLRLTGSWTSGVAYDNNMGWRFVRNLETPKVSFNSDGFRDREFALVKKPGSRRIIFIGDSYTVGTRIAKDLIFTSLFQHGMNDGEEEYEVMNMAVSAWATDQQLSLLRNEAAAFKPEYVFLMIAPNDIREAYGKRFYQLTEGELTENGPPEISTWERFAWWLSNRSVMFSAAQKVISPQMGEHGSFQRIFHYFPTTFPLSSGEYANDKHLVAIPQDPVLLEARELFTELFRAFHHVCRNEGIQLMVSVVPTKMEFHVLNDNDEKANSVLQPGLIADYVSGLAKENGIPYMDLFSAFKQDEDPLRFFISDEYHFSEAGHAFAATSLVDFFKEHENLELN